MFYGGLVRAKNVLGTMMHSFVSIAIIGVLWVVCGYSLTFGKTITDRITRQAFEWLMHHWG